MIKKEIGDLMSFPPFPHRPTQAPKVPPKTKSSSSLVDPSTTGKAATTSLSWFQNLKIWFSSRSSKPVEHASVIEPPKASSSKPSKGFVGWVRGLFHKSDSPEAPLQAHASHADHSATQFRAEDGTNLTAASPAASQNLKGKVKDIQKQIYEIKAGRDESAYASGLPHRPIVMRRLIELHKQFQQLQADWQVNWPAEYGDCQEVIQQLNHELQEQKQLWWEASADFLIAKYKRFIEKDAVPEYLAQIKELQARYQSVFTTTDFVGTPAYRKQHARLDKLNQILKQYSP